jgi:2'-5' RNA ligase
MRLFVAVRPPAEALAELGELVDRLATFRAGARLADRAHWHLTVAFLGDVPETRVPDVSAALTAAAGPATPLRLRLAGGGRFGRGRFAVLWAGVDGADDGALGAFAGLARGVRRQLRRARLPYDDKPFRPHLTLARPGDKVGPAELAADLDLLRGFTGVPFPVDRLLLFRSELGPHPVHQLLSEHLLGA